MSTAPAATDTWLDTERKRVIICQQPATTAFWDTRWQADIGRLDALLATTGSFVSDVTRRYLRPADGPILEGGCGTGKHVAALASHGYFCIGLDYARETMLAIRERRPDLPLVLGDLHALSLGENTLAAFWSLGVIEHFWDGYGPLLEEMARVIRPGGYLFLTFPALTPLRKFKARAGLYRRWPGGPAPDRFYQFLLDPQVVAGDTARLGFDLVTTQPMAGLIGFKNEAGALGRLLRPLERYQGRSLVVRGLRRALDRLLSPLAGHSVLLVLRRNGAVNSTP